MRLDGKKAIVTGAASGFGAGIARKFVAEGASVLIADLNFDGAQELAYELGPNAFACQANVADNESVAAMIAQAISDLGGVDILVNNAGTTHLPSAMEDVTEADFDKIFLVNCKSVYLAAKHAVPLFKKQSSGAILNVASTAAVSPRPRLSWYNASKGWMTNATRGMAIELAPHGVRVNAINPVAGETPCSKASWARIPPKCVQSSYRPFRLAGFQRPKTWEMPLATFARTRPVWSQVCAWKSTAGAAFRL